MIVKSSISKELNVSCSFLFKTNFKHSVELKVQNLKATIEKLYLPYIWNIIFLKNIIPIYNKWPCTNSMLVWPLTLEYL